MSEDEQDEVILEKVGFDGLAPIKDAPISSSTAIAAVAFNMAMKYTDIATVKDGVLYQQYKLEGKNLQTLHLDMVFETASRIEKHLVASNERVALLVLEQISQVLEGEKGGEEEDEEQG